MEQKQADFKIRFDNQSKEHDKILTDIKNKLAEDIRKAQLATETKMKSISARSDDPFYRIEKLEPKLTENAKNYFVSLNIPEHEKENVHLVAHGRNLKLTLSKKFEDNVVDEDGTFNKSSKSQLFSKEIATNDLVNPKKIAENYENGVLTFKVDKL
jgi:HSP20 family molecular chaperone IbpA